MNLKSFFAECRNKYKFSISDSIELVNENHWNALLNEGNIYLSLPYLKAIEASLTQLDFRYILVYDQKNKPLMAAYFQIIDFKDYNHDYAEWLNHKFGNKVVQKIINNLDMRMLINGNLFACGENGFVKADYLSDAECFDILNLSIKRIGKHLENGEKATLYMFKEFWPRKENDFDLFNDESFYPLDIDCNMVLKMHPEWIDADTYYGHMTSKFRTKANGIFQKSEAVIIEDWNQDQIWAHSHDIDRLHNNILDNADFNLGSLNARAFIKLKENLKDAFLFKAYKIDQTLVGFSVSFVCDSFLDAAFVGLDYQYNASHAIYQRMLHDFVHEGIKQKSKEIRFGRTAEQMKSTLGAVPVQMHVFIRHRNKITNHLIKPIAENIKPSKFEMRYPFKATFSYA